MYSFKIIIAPERFFGFFCLAVNTEIIFLCKYALFVRLLELLQY